MSPLYVFVGIFQLKCEIYYIRPVLDLLGVGGSPLWCLSTPQVFIDPHWFSVKTLLNPSGFVPKRVLYQSNVFTCVVTLVFFKIVGSVLQRSSNLLSERLYVWCSEPPVYPSYPRHYRTGDSEGSCDLVRGSGSTFIRPSRVSGFHDLCRNFRLLSNIYQYLLVLCVSERKLKHHATYYCSPTLLNIGCRAIDRLPMHRYQSCSHVWNNNNRLTTIIYT